MSWGRLDDGFHDHPKVEELSLAAVGLWTLCLSRALRHRRTDAVPGFVPEARVRKLAGRQTKALATELTTPPPGKKFGLWEPVEGGWIIHDFSDYLPKGRDPEEAAESGRKGAAAKWAKQGKAIANSHSNSHTDSHSDSHAPSQDTAMQADGSPLADDMAPDGSRASARAFPSRPVPSRTTQDQDLGGDRPETLRPTDATKPPPDEPPPGLAINARCTAHRGNPDPPPCAGCQQARERAERKADAAAERAAREREAAARACTRCDGVHITDEHGNPTRRKCDHRRAS
jgi:hypothetical protein